MAGAEYRMDMSAADNFLIELRQTVGGSGDLILTPRGTYSTVAGTLSGGLTGPPYQQTLQETSETQIAIQKTGDPRTRSITFTVNPATAQLKYRKKVAGAPAFDSWIEPVMVNGKFSIESLSVAEEMWSLNFLYLYTRCSRKGKEAHS